MPDPAGHPAAEPFVLALDGPAGSGKSVVGQAVARALGFFYFDTGVLYRALTWVALDRGAEPGDEGCLVRVAEAIQFEVRSASVADGRQVDVLADGEDITWAIRRPEVDAAVSLVAAHARVRDALVGPQRDAVQSPGTVVAGRDIGTVIFPDARLKVWLTASPEERARRRSAQSGEPYESVLRAMRERDRYDGARTIAPMMPAEDAITVDSDDLSVEQVVERIVTLARSRIPDPKSSR